MYPRFAKVSIFFSDSRLPLHRRRCFSFAKSMTPRGSAVDAALGSGAGLDLDAALGPGAGLGAGWGVALGFGAGSGSRLFRRLDGLHKMDDEEVGGHDHGAIPRDGHDFHVVVV